MIELCLSGNCNWVLSYFNLVGYSRLANKFKNEQENSN